MAPWFYLLVATGARYAVGLLQRFGLPWSGDAIMRFFAYAVAAAGIWFAFEHPILREPHQREFGVGSVPCGDEAVETALSRRRRPYRVYSPFPATIPPSTTPSKFGVAATINGPPAHRRTTLSLARPGDDPTTTLRDVVVKQDAFVDAIGALGRSRQSFPN